MYCICVVSPGCRGTVYQTADLKRSTGLTYLNKLYLTSPVSCSSNSKKLFFSHFMWSHALLCSLLSFFPLFVCVCVCVCVCVLSGAAPLPGVDTVAGRLQECEALSQVSASVSVLPASITKQLRSLYSHQLPRRPLLLHLYCQESERETTSSLSLIGHDPSKADPSLCGQISAYTTVDTSAEYVI